MFPSGKVGNSERMRGLDIWERWCRMILINEKLEIEQKEEEEEGEKVLSK